MNNPLSSHNTDELPSQMGYLISEGKVERIEDDTLWVQTQRQEGGCNSCHAQSSCGTSTLSKLFTKQKSEWLKVENRCQAEEGDVVALRIKESVFIQHSLMAYGIPLLGLFIGALSFQALFPHIPLLQGVHAQDLFSALGAAVGMGVGWWSVKRFYHPIVPEAFQVIKSKEGVELLQ